MMYYMVLYLLLTCLAIVYSNTQCGTSCVCHSGSGEVTAHCTNIGLTSWPLDLPLNITTLDISHNPLTYLQELPILPHLHRLDARYCGLKSVSHDLLSQMPELQELELGHNKMVAFPEVQTQGKALRSLSLDNNKIQALAPGILKDVHLDQLNLQQNSLSIVHPNSFNGASIITLSLDWCSIDSRAMTDMKSPFTHLSTSLKHLFWSHNLEGLQHLPQDIFTGLRLDHLQLTHNSLRDATFLEFNVTVKDLDLSHNTMSELDITACCTNTVSAKFSNCSIYRLNYNINNNHRASKNGASTALEVLDLAFNKLTYISSTVLIGMVNLKELNIEGNPLSKLGYNTETPIEFVHLEILTVINTPISCDCQNEALVYLHSAGTTLKGMHCGMESSLLQNGLGSSLCFKPSDVILQRNTSRNAITCFARGIPAPRLEWFCDGQSLGTLETERIFQAYDNSTTNVIYLADINQQCSLLSCTASNQKGSKTVEQSLSDKTPIVRGSSSTIRSVNKVVFLIIAICGSVLLGIGILILCIFRGKLRGKCIQYHNSHSACPETASGHCQSQLLINS